MKIFITFGQQHTHPHNGVTLDKDCVGVIDAESEEEARKLAFEWFGPEFGTTYPEIDNEFMDFFPRGAIDLN
tara:strand:- start:38 stop:253 length:216 start_codon:yes stop_codon:yes gene_type:complete